MNISIPVHTVLTLIGPSNCAKSYFANLTVKKLKEQYPKLNFHVVSSDEIRRDLIGEDLHKHDQEMLYASQAAFDVLYNKLRNLLSFPLSFKNVVVIVDTTGMSEQFRKDINKIAEEYQYNTASIVFDYKDYEDYFKYAGEMSSDSKKIIANHVKRLRTKVLPTIRKKDYSAGTFKIRHLTENFNDVTVELTNVEEYLTCFLPTKNENGDNIEYSIIGDIHQSHEDLIKLTTQLGFQIENGKIKGSNNKKIVLVGDIIDQKM